MRPGFLQAPATKRCNFAVAASEGGGRGARPARFVHCRLHGGCGHARAEAARGHGVPAAACASF
eukprot:11694224-Alexandrium_andersonii.AAC.1